MMHSMNPTMYFIFVSTDSADADRLETVLHGLDRGKNLLSIKNGFDLIQFLQDVKRGESYPDLIIMSTKMTRLTGRELMELLKADDIYCLIPILVFLPELNGDDDVFYKRFGVETMVTPNVEDEWVSAAKRMCTVCE